MSTVTRDYIPFEKVDVSRFGTSAPKVNTNGKGKFIWIDTPRDLTSQFSTPRDMRQKWNVKPDGPLEGTSIKEHQKFNLEVEVGPEFEGFHGKCTEFDKWAIEQGFSKKKEWFGAKHADAITHSSALLMTQGRMLKKGAEKEGTVQPDTVRFKIDGWAAWCDSVEFDEKQPGLVKECTWKDRPASDLGPKGKETRFILHIAKDQLTGIDRQTEKVPIIDAAGNPVKDPSGNIKYRWVGPQDAKANSKITVVFAFTKIHLSDNKFSVILTAREVQIKPAPPKVKGRLEGVEIVSQLDPQLAAKAVQNSLLADSDVPSDTEDNASVNADDIPVHPAEGNEEPPVATGETIKKRKKDDSAAKADKTEGSPIKKKKTESKPKTIALEEDF